MQARFERGAVRRAQLGSDVPVFLRAEEFDLVLAVADDAQSDRLHPAGRARARQLAPQDRGEVEADQIVQRPAGKVGVDEFGIDLARVFHGGRNRALGDRVEHDALDDGVLFQRPALLQRFYEVPGNGFPFAVRVSRQDQRVGILEGVGDVGNALGRLGVRFPHHLEIIVRIDRAILGGKVADMPVGGQDFIVLAQVLVDRFGLGGRLYDDKFHALSLFKGGRNGPGGPAMSRPQPC